MAKIKTLSDSEIEKELLAAAQIDYDSELSDDEYFKLIISSVDSIDDEDWTRLSSKAQKYYNDLVDALNTNEAFPWFPDAKKPDDAGSKKAEKAPARRRVVDDDDKKPEPPAKQVDDAQQDSQLIDWDDVEQGDRLLVVTTNDNEYEGEVVSISDSALMLDTGEEERRFSKRRVAEIERFGPASDDSTPEPGEDNGEEPDPEPEKEKTSRRRAPAGKKEEKAPARKTRRSSTQVVREYVCDNPGASLDDVLEYIETEGIKCAPSTAEMTMSETQKTLDYLRESDRLK